jgi:hypothetical protein
MILGTGTIAIADILAKRGTEQIGGRHWQDGQSDGLAGRRLRGRIGIQNGIQNGDGGPKLLTIWAPKIGVFLRRQKFSDRGQGDGGTHISSTWGDPSARGNTRIRGSQIPLFGTIWPLPELDFLSGGHRTILVAIPGTAKLSRNYLATIPHYPMNYLMTVGHRLGIIDAQSGW